MLTKILLPTLVEIETSTYCNRLCKWCPNYVYPRGREKKFIKPELFRKIIKDLVDIDYHDKLALHNYNEPLLDPNIYEYISFVHKCLPKACINIFTNGDFVDEKSCAKLVESGVSTLWITLHQAIGTNNPVEIVESHLRKTLGRHDLCNKSDLFGVKLETFLGSMQILYYVPLKTALSSRGNILNDFKKSQNDQFVCLVPFSCSAIDYQGNMKICFEMYPGHELHNTKGVVGNLEEYSFEELWFSDFYQDLRRKLLINESDNDICEYCGKNDLDIEMQNMIKEKLTLWDDYLNKKVLENNYDDGGVYE